MSSHPDYEEMIKEAEKAVAPVKDPELKRIAFEKILDACSTRSPAGKLPSLQRSTQSKGKTMHDVPRNGAVLRATSKS